MELRGFDQRCEACPVDRALVVAREETVFAIQCNGTHCPLDAIGVHLDPAVVEEADQAVPAGQPVADRFGNGALLRDREQPVLEPGL
jgi:hypothetical protein